MSATIAPVITAERGQPHQVLRTNAAQRRLTEVDVFVALAASRDWAEAVLRFRRF